MRVYFEHLIEPVVTKDLIRITLDDGHYQLWQNGEMLVEGYDVADTLFAHGSTVEPANIEATH